MLHAEPQVYARLVGGIALGKRLPDALYLHADALKVLAPPVQRLVSDAVLIAGGDVRWNVVKLNFNEPKISLLWYPRFFEDGFPELLSTTTVQLATGESSSRTYAEETAPILHRKEMLLPPDHPAVPQAEALTREAEALGLFEGAREIGQKVAWQARLHRIGLKVQ